MSRQTETTTSTTTLVSTTSTTTTTNNTPTTLSEAMKTVELVKEQINQYDIQSSKYKTILRNITANSTTTTTKKDDPNRVTIEWVKVRQNDIHNSIIYIERQATIELICRCVSNKYCSTFHHSPSFSPVTALLSSSTPRSVRWMLERW